MNRLNLGDLADLINGHLLLGGLPPWDGLATPVGRIVLNSRCVEPGDIFWECDDPRVGSCAEEALARGSAGVVVSGRHVEPWAGGFTIRVDDAPQALWRLAQWSRFCFPGVVVAVSGPESNAWSRLLHAVLATEAEGLLALAHGEPRHNLPMALTKLNESHRYAVVEIPTDHRVATADFSDLCCPHIAVITSPDVDAGSNQAAFQESAGDLVASLPDDGWLIAHGMAQRVRRGRLGNVVDGVNGFAAAPDAEPVVFAAATVGALLGVDPELIAGVLLSALSGVVRPEASPTINSFMRKENAEAPPLVSGLRESDSALPPGSKRFAC